MQRALMIALALMGLPACTPDRAVKSADEGETSNVATGSEMNGMAKGAIPPAPARQSQFSSIDPATCQLLEENVEEGGWSHRRCNALAGYTLELTDSDLRQDIIVIDPAQKRTELGLTEIVANGAFNALGKTAEWRGRDAAKPETLIVRLGVAPAADGTQPDVSNLVVVKLQPTPCIVAIVAPGSGHNEKARSIADGQAPACVKR